MRMRSHLLTPGVSHYPKIYILAQGRPHFEQKEQMLYKKNRSFNKNVAKTIACAHVFTPVVQLLASGGSHYPNSLILAQDIPQFGTKGTHV